MSRFPPRGFLVPLIVPAMLALASCAGNAIPARDAKPAAAPSGTPAATGAVHAPAKPVMAKPNKAFLAWMDGVRAEARTKGISEQTLKEALDGIGPVPRVIELDRRQPETTMTFALYQTRIVSEARISQGRAALAAKRPLLSRISRERGVPPEIILALWGIESNFGRLTGGYNVFAALATLAYDGRRSAFFRDELMKALAIVEGDHLPAERMTGSWAGAMGQCQFMPSSFLKFAADGDGDGRRDIWTNEADVFASAANYLATVGWKRGERWGWPVSAPRGLDAKLASLDVRKTPAEWARLGVKPLGKWGPAAGQTEAGVSLVRPDGPDGPSYLVGDNYRAILRWNRSSYFAVAVGTLGDRIMAE